MEASEEGNVKLFDDQRAVLDKVRAAFLDGHRSVMLYGPTGMGKTECAISMLKATGDNYKRAAMMLDRIVLCNQTSARLQKYNIDHGVLQAGHWRHRPYERIQVCSAQTIEKRGSFPGLNLLIVDEAHTQRQQTTEFIKNNPEIKVIGLSASPFAEGLGQTYTKVVSATTTAKLVDEKRLVPLRVFIAKEINMAGAKKVAGEWSQAEAGARGMKITGDVVAEWAKKTTEIFGGPRKTIVFCSNVAHGADLAQKFAEAGYNFVPISYKDSDEFKIDAVADFSKPDTKIHGLIACDILTKGFDVPDVMIGVSARPFTKSFMSHIQQMGRVMRSYPEKEFALWLCMARGSRVLTDEGLVPIEQVSLSHKIWDGTNFVTHRGAVCNGIQKVITYRGLTATPGHLVHTAQGWRTFGDCAREQIAITQTGLGGRAIRLGEDHFAGCSVAGPKESALDSCAVRVRKVWLSVRNFFKQFGGRANAWMPVLQSAGSGLPDVALCASAGDARTLPQPQGCELPALWRVGGGVPIRGREGWDALDHGEHGHSGQPGRHATGSGRPDRALRAGQYPLADSGSQPTEQARESGCGTGSQIQAGSPRDSILGQHAQAAVLVGDDAGANHREIQPAIGEAEREVWDILDCGPSNRFTCEGLLVHNCHSGNYLRFQEDWDDLYHEGVHELCDGKEKAKKEKSDKEKEAAKCPQCGALWIGRSDNCASCGFHRPFTSLVEAVPGEMEELKGAPTKAVKQSWYSQLRTIASDRGYSDGWVAHKYREKFGVWPRNLNDTNAPVTIEVAKWEQSRRIAWAKSKRGS